MVCLKKPIFSLLAFTVIIITANADQTSQILTVEQARDKVNVDRQCRIGEEMQFVIPFGQAARLDCRHLEIGLTEVLFWTDEQRLYMYCDWEDGHYSKNSKPLSKQQIIWIPSPSRISFLFNINMQVGAANVKIQAETDKNTMIQESIRKHKESLKTIGPNERLVGFIRLWAKIKYNFANFDLVPELDWDKVLVEYLPRVQREQTLPEYNRLLAECVSRLKDGHTDVHVRPCLLFEDAQPALLVRPIEGRAVITEVGQSRDVVEAGLRRGEEIISIDGRAIQDILEKDIYPYEFASTPQGRDIKAFNHLLRGPAESEVVLQIRDLAGNEREVKLKRQLAWSKGMPAKDSKPVKYRDLGDNIAYIAIDTFASNKVIGEFDKIMKSIGKINGLIIDVRENGGGSSSNGDAIISRLIDKPIPSTLWKTPQHIAAFEAWGRPKKWFVGEADTIEPYQGENYLGPLVILIGPETVSAAEDFVVPLHASTRATLVGEKTAGTTGQPLQFDFSHIILGRVCTKRDTYPDGREFVGVGIIPDVEIHPSPADIAADRDIVLQKGLEVLRVKTE